MVGQDRCADPRVEGRRRGKGDEGARLLAFRALAVVNRVLFLLNEFGSEGIPNLPKTSSRNLQCFP